MSLGNDGPYELSLGSFSILIMDMRRLRLPIRAEHPRPRMTSGRLPAQEEMDSKREVQCHRTALCCLSVTTNPIAASDRL